MKARVGYKKTKLFSFHRLKMLQQLFLMEQNPTPSWSMIGTNGIDPSSGVFIDWLEKKLSSDKPLPTNAKIAWMIKNYNFREQKAKEQYEREHA